MSRFADTVCFAWCKLRHRDHRADASFGAADGDRRTCQTCQTVGVFHEGHWRWVDG